jgi:crotonobetaine/carnitine-CoA ligase
MLSMAIPRTVGELLRVRAADFPDQPFVKCGGDHYLTYGELDERSDRLAAGLVSLGLAQGDRIAMIMPNRVEMIELFFACAKLGVIQVPLNYWLRGSFLEHQLQDCSTSVFVGDALGIQAAAPFFDSAAIKTVISVDAVSGASYLDYATVAGSTAPVPDVALRPRDLMSIIYTSGTTGLPKGCMLSHGYYTACGLSFHTADWVIPRDRIFTSYPMFHLSGRCTLMTALVANASICYEEEFHASTFMQRAADENATMLWGVVSMGLAILAQPARPEDSNRCFRLATFTPMPESAQSDFERRFNTPVIAEGFGQTEVSPATLNRPDQQRKKSTCGPAAMGKEIRIVDEDDNEVPAGSVGEIVVRPTEPDVMFSGYWRQAEATLEAFRNFWHHTGDLGSVDEDGFLTFVDRKTDSLRRRGENVSSAQLEEAICRYPTVQEVAVCGVPSPVGEGDILACMVVSEPTETSDLFAFLSKELPYFAVPRYIRFCDELPKNVLGKVLKNVLRDQGVTADTVDFEAQGLTVTRSARRG